jgi:hypothetical protein
MTELVKLILPFFTITANYGEVLKRLAAFAFYETYVITLILRANPQVDAFFNGIESWGSVGRVLSTLPDYKAVNVSGLVVGLFVAVLTFVFQLHDKISDVLGLRRRFDCKEILIPLAQRVGSNIDEAKKENIIQQRDELMHAVFYKYASSRAESPLVDKHDIEHALNAWSWFWVLVEAVLYFSAGAIIALCTGSPKIALAFGMVSVIVFVLGVLQHIRLGKYARPQIKTIAADPTASYDIKRRFDAL